LPRTNRDRLDVSAVLFLEERDDHIKETGVLHTGSGGQDHFLLS
jgi:hypothetical protein